MLTYQHPKITKADFLADIREHREADRFLQGTYLQGRDAQTFRGCAVGCSLETVRKKIGAPFKLWEHDNHAAYEEFLGVPAVLARLEDRIFEGLPIEKAKEWPLRFSEAIPVGVDLSMVWPRFALWLLSEEVPQHAKTDRTKAALAAVAALYREWCDGTEPTPNRWNKVRNAAYADAKADAVYAAVYAVYAAYAAAYAADAYADAYAAAYAAEAAAYAAADAATYAAAYAAAYAADAYAYAAADAAAYAAAAYAAADARQSCYERMADKLVEIIAACQDQENIT